MNNVPEGALLETKLRSMLAGRHFSICDVDSLAAALHIVVPSCVREQLHPLHCVDWADMTEELRDWVAKTLAELFLDGQRKLGIQHDRHGKLTLVKPGVIRRLLG